MTVTSTANIAILGCGRQGRVHANNILQVGGPARVYAVYDAFEAASVALSESHPHRPKVASSVEEILADPLVDGVIIVTPNSTHAALVIQVAAAGKACICEKPLDSSLEAIKVLRVQLAELAKKQPLPYIAVGFPKRHDPTYNAMRTAIEEKKLGDLEQLIIWSRDTFPQPLEYMKGSGGQIIDSSIHDLDLAQAMLGPDDQLESVSVVGSTLVLPEACAEAKDTTRIVLTIKSKLGRIVIINGARRCVAGHDQRLEAHCSLGDMRADNPPAKDIHLHISTPTAGQQTEPWFTTTAERYTAAMLQQTKELVAACVGGRGPLPSGQQKGASIEDGYWASQAAVAAQESLREGKTVYLAQD